MASITFRTDEEIEAIIQKGIQGTGLDQSELCRVAVLEYIGREAPDKIQRAHNKHRVRQIKKKVAA